MEIKFETIGYGCLTDCPHKMTDKNIIYSKETFIIKVGSIICSECKYFFAVDQENNIVTCLKKENKND